MTITEEKTSTLEETFGPGETDDDDTVSTPAPFRFPDFEGLDVIGARIELRGVGGGLNEAIDVAPVVLRQGDEFDVTYRCKVGPIRHDPIKKDEPDGEQYRVHIAYASRAVIVPMSKTQAEFDAQAEQIAARKAAEEAEKNRKEELAGQMELGDAVDNTPTEPFLGYDELPASEVVERINTYGDNDADAVDAIEAYEEATGGRAEILMAIKQWRDGSDS